MPREIPRGLLQVGKVVGQGAFGEVCKGTLDEQDSRGVVGLTVAVKTARLDMNDMNLEQQAAFVDLIQEAALMVCSP